MESPSAKVGDDEIKFRIGRIRLDLPHVVRDAGAADHRAGRAVLAAHLLADRPDPDQPLAQDDVIRHQAPVHLQPRPHLGDELAGALDERLIHIVVKPADAVIAVGQARAGDAFQQIENLLPVIERIEQRREPAQIQQEGAPPDQMAGDAVQLGGDDADILRPRRHLQLRRPLDRPDKRVRVGHRRQIINAAGIGQELRVSAVLAHLLLHPVDVAADRFGADDILAVHRHLDAQHAVCRRMLRPEVEDKGLARALAVAGDWLP